MNGLLMDHYTRITPVVYAIEKLAKLAEDNNIDRIKRVDNVVIQFGSRFLHLGKICYSDFKVQNRSNRNLLVNENTINLVHVEFAKKLLLFLAIQLLDGKRVVTLFNDGDYFVSLFNSNFTQSFNLNFTKANIVRFIRGYTDSLLHEIKIYDRSQRIGLSTHTAQSYQSRALSFFAFASNLDKTELTNSLFMIRRNNHQVHSTEALKEKELTEQFNFYTHIFRQLSEIVLQHIEIPTKLTYNNTQNWICPSHTQWLKPKHKTSIGLIGFNYETGKFYSVDELLAMEHCSYKKRYQILQHIKQATTAKTSANKPYSALRRILSGWACRAYFMHFLSITGENDSTAASLIFHDEYLIEKDGQNFKSIKWRANGKEVVYSIQNEFIDDFKAFVKLRSYLLEYYDIDYDSLFIGTTLKGITPLSSKGDASCNIRKQSSAQFTGYLMPGTSRSLRTTKSLWLRKKFGSGVSSYVLQHSSVIADSHYTTLDNEDASLEMQEFFESIDNKLLEQRNLNTQLPSGHCYSYKSPETIKTRFRSQKLALDCSSPIACLFCRKYRVHTDLTDIKKLLSMKYVILHSRPLAESNDHFNNVYGPTLIRINNIVSHIKKQSEQLEKVVTSVTKEVFEDELLSEYWYRKLELLNELGIVEPLQKKPKEI